MNRIPHIQTLACLCLLLASCGRQDEARPRTLQPIGLDIAPSSRAAVLSSDAITSLGLYGYSTGTDVFNPADPAHLPNLFCNRAASRPAAGAWNYGNPPVYWPIDLAVNNTFFAYSPHQSMIHPLANFAASDASTPGNPYVVYTVPPLSELHADLLYSGPVADINRDTRDGKVLYPMKHATAWIAFLIAPQKSQNDNETYTLKSLSFSGENLTTRGVLDLSTGTWTGVQSSQALYSVKVNTSAIPVNTIAPAEAGNCYLMLIPQRIIGAVNNCMIYMTYTYHDGDPETPDEEYAYTTPFPETYLNAGNIMTYVIKLSTNGIFVDFSGSNTIEEWVAGTNPTPIEVY